MNAEYAALIKQMDRISAGMKIKYAKKAIIELELGKLNQEMHEKECEKLNLLNQIDREILK